ncbi:MAG: serine/threonine-protein kinase, partial [Rhodospirillales bacterium]|nr:serine/threonine-protein kinase [Rhodospirillales bacterium]
MKLPERYKQVQPQQGGGMSDAVICKDEPLDRLVVIKSLKAGTDQRRLLDELAALQAIRSKHVVQIYDLIRDNNGQVMGIVEEYLSGVDLTQVPPPNNFSEFIRVAYPVAKGIADIHAHEIIHRDIKRQNMKFDAEACLKVFDFGLARTDSVDANTVGAIGTPGYMAPELFEATAGGKVHFTNAVDTYAFAATLIALVRGKLPSQMRSIPPPKLPSTTADFRSLSWQLPGEISDALNGCLSTNPAQRPSMSEVAHLFELYMLKDQHRALLVSNGKIHVLDKDNSSVSLNATGRGSLNIRYDGLRFIVKEVQGAVAVNNMPIQDDTVLP